MAERMYRVDEVLGAGLLSMSTLRTRQVARFEIRAKDDKLVKVYERDPKMRGIALRQAAIMCDRYEAHYRKTGERFELVQENKRNLEKNKKRLAYIQNEAIPKLQAEATALIAKIEEAQRE